MSENELSENYSENIDDKSYLEALVNRAKELIENEDSIKEMKALNKPKQKRFFNDEQKERMKERLAVARERAYEVRMAKKQIKDGIKEEEKKEFDELKKKYTEIKKNGGSINDINIKPKTNNRIRNEPVKVEPAKVEPVKIEEKKVEPVKVEPVKIEEKKEEPIKQIKQNVNVIPPKQNYFIPSSKWNRGGFGI